MPDGDRIDLAQELARVEAEIRKADRAISDAVELVDALRQRTSSPAVAHLGGELSAPT